MVKKKEKVCVGIVKWEYCVSVPVATLSFPNKRIKVRILVIENPPFTEPIDLDLHPPSMGFHLQKGQHVNELGVLAG